MDKIFQINWDSVFVPTVSLLEIVLRGTVVYLMIFIYYLGSDNKKSSVSLSPVTRKGSRVGSPNRTTRISRSLLIGLGFWFDR